MAATESAIVTILERLRTYLDSSDVDAKYSNTYILRNVVQPTLVDILSRLNNGTAAPIFNTITIPLREGQTLYKLPPCVQEVWQVVGVDNEGRTLSSFLPRNLGSMEALSWSLEGSGGNLELYVPVTAWGPRCAGSLQVWYVSNGSSMLHWCDGATVGANLDNFSFTSGTWNNTTRALSISVPTNYVWEPGDRVTITAGSGDIILGEYEIEGATSFILTLATSLKSGLTNPTGIAGRIWLRKAGLSTGTPTIGTRDRRPSSYVGQTLRIIPESDSAVISEVLIASHYLSGSQWFVTTRSPFDPGPALPPGEAPRVPYEIVCSGMEALMEAVSAGSAMRLGAATKITKGNQDAIRLQYLSALKSVLDNLNTLQTAGLKTFGGNTTPYQSSMGPSSQGEIR